MLLLTLHHTSSFLSFNSTQYKKQKHIEKSIFLFWNIYLITFPFFDDNNMKNKLSSLSFFCHLPPKCCIYADCVFFGVTLISSFICVGSVDLCTEWASVLLCVQSGSITVFTTPFSEDLQLCDRRPHKSVSVPGVWAGRPGLQFNNCRSEEWVTAQREEEMKEPLTVRQRRERSGCLNDGC